MNREREQDRGSGMDRATWMVRLSKTQAWTEGQGEDLASRNPVRLADGRPQQEIRVGETVNLIFDKLSMRCQELDSVGWNP